MIILEANKLAAKNKLCRVTDSVRRDTKSNCVVVTETVYTLNKSGEAERKESYYHYKSMVDTDSMDGLIQECKARSTYYFLGLEIPEQVVAKVIEDKVVGTTAHFYPAYITGEHPVCKFFGLWARNFHWKLTRISESYSLAYGPILFVISHVIQPLWRHTVVVKRVFRIKRKLHVG